MFKPYSPEWLSLPFHYVARVAESLGDQVLQWWDDPFDPRDATIRLTDGTALVWDEESGWRHGVFVGGEQGVRTVLADAAYLGGDVLPGPAEVAGLLAAGGAAERPHYRSYSDHEDGFDLLLAAYAVSVPV